VSAYRVVVTDVVGDDLSAERLVLGDVADLVSLDAKSPADLVGKVEDADAIIAFNIELRADQINALKRCRGIVRCGVGYDNIDVIAARKRGIPVMNVPDYGTEEVADAAIGLALSLTRGTHLYNARLRRGLENWTFRQTTLTRLRGRVFGIVGLGRIGTATAVRAKALGMDVTFYDPFKPDGYDKSLGVRRAETLADLLSISHVLSLHCPLTADNRHMIDEAALARMHPGSFLVNTGRGALVDLSAIPDAIRSGQLAGAGIDVFPDEPPPEDHPLIVAWRDVTHPAHDRVILTPHAAFYCEEGLREIRVKGAMSARRVLLGEPLRNVVN
jgi:C-terminal binding protein